jgi:Protein of unknown function (DUF4230)
MEEPTPPAPGPTRASTSSGRLPLPLWPLILVNVLLALGTVLYLVNAKPNDPSSVVSVRPSATLLVAMKDVAKLETTELHLEKVIDLTDTQSNFFGLIEGTDNLLLIASGDVTVGVDLGKLTEGDVTMDPKTRAATIKLPTPEIFSSRLDEKRTYVYTRSTSLAARRNEQLETKARQEAVAAIEKAAQESDVTERAKKQAERQLRALAMALGASDVIVTWK